MVQLSFFNMADRYKELSAFGDPLEQLNKVINFEMLTGSVYPWEQREGVRLTMQC